MTESKFTPWFPQTERPARPGVYQREMDYCLDEIGYAMWSGRSWFPCYNSAHAAESKYRSRQPSGYQCEDEGIRWRGLAQATGEQA